MKKFILPLTLVLIASPALAKPVVTPIQFAKGSDCGYFEGNVKNRELTLNLKKGQYLIVTVSKSFDEDDYVNPKLKDPKGKDQLPFSSTVFVDEYLEEYQIAHTGKHRFTFDLYDEYTFAEIKFCAYDK
ncbi:hypothetical protein [Moraxella oblonga]|uniref:hypothetical protein n=1 Tax=Moraxella oblonga TaxID=200413 RepID=UPI00082D4C46|nr:hypothetical protein [Moraxella oblonga]